MAVTERHIKRAVELAKEYNAKKLILFGSALDNPEMAKDLDLAADIPGIDIYVYAGRLENEFGFVVDIIPLDIKSKFMDLVNKYGKVIYESK